MSVQCPDRGPRFFVSFVTVCRKKLPALFSPLSKLDLHTPLLKSPHFPPHAGEEDLSKRFIQFYLSKSHISYVFCEDFVGQRGIFSASQENLQRLEGTLKDLVAICVNFRHCRVAWYCSLPNALTQPFDFSFLFNKRKGFVIGEWGIF